MIKGFIFDLDGVITDTAEQHYLAWKHLSDEMGWDFNREVNENLRGISRMDSLKFILNHNNISLDDETLQELATKKNVMYQDLLNDITPDDFLPGAKEILTHLRTEGFHVALGSSSKNAKKVLEQLGAIGYFDIVGDGHSVTKSKPDPAIFLYSAEKLGLQAEECVVFEDAEKGIDAANAGGFHSVGIGPQERVGHAHLRFDSMADATLFEIKSFFKELF